MYMVLKNEIGHPYDTGVTQVLVDQTSCGCQHLLKAVHYASQIGAEISSKLHR